MAGSNQLQAQVRFVEATPKELAPGRPSWIASGQQGWRRLGTMEVWVPEGATVADCADAMQRLRAECERISGQSLAGQKPATLRTMSSHFDRIADSLRDHRARHIHRRSALDQPEDPEDE